MAEENGGADVEMKVAGQELNIRNAKSLNTVVTVLNFFGFCVLAVFIYFAQAQAQKETINDKEDHLSIVKAIEKANAAQVQAYKEAQSANNVVLEKISVQAERQSQAQRETNCLLSLPQDRRVNSAETCRRISR